MCRFVHISRRSGRFALVAFFVTFFIGVPVLPAYSANDPATPPKTIVVAVPTNFPPWVIPGEAGATTGILKELWALWEARTGVPVKLQPMPLGEIKDAILSGQADVADALVRTAEREAWFDFSAPHLETHVMLYFNEALSGIVDARTARGFVVGVAAGDACVAKLEEEGLDTLKKFPTHEAMVAAAVNDEIHLFCAQRPVANYFLSRFGKTSAFRHTPPLYFARAHWVVRKGNESLYREVNEGFKKISAKENDEIINRWYGARIDDYELPLHLRYAGYILIALLAGAALLLGWNRSLRRKVDLRTADLQKMLGDLRAAQKSLDEKNTALSQTLHQTVSALSAAMAHRDLSTAGHEHRVSELSVAIGRELGFDENRLEGLGIAAMIHDVGQIQVPAEILTRPRRLSPEEFDLVRMHAEAGRDILRDIKFPWPVADIVHQHHENMDGSGYPRGLAGEDILPEARIIRVADSVEAMLSHRPFRRAATIDAAVGQLLAGKGALYDSEVVDACIRLVEQNWRWLTASKNAARPLVTEQ